MLTEALADGRPRAPELSAVLVRRVRRRRRRRLAGIVADGGGPSHAAVTALLTTQAPLSCGFARSRPITAHLAARAGPQRRGLADGGALNLGACPWDTQRRLRARGARTPTATNGPWVAVTSLWGTGPQRLIRLDRQRWRGEPVIDELLHGLDLDHLGRDRLTPNRGALGRRRLARNLASGPQSRAAGGRPATIRA